jgi:class 3 adenylate cyclase
MGDGPQELVFVPGFVSHLDLMWDVPFYAQTAEQLANLGRLIVFDKRGTGLSDRSLGFGSIAERMDDIRAVMDAAGVQRAGLVGVSEGGPLAILFAATYPDRVTKLGLYGTFAYWGSTDDPDVSGPDLVDMIVPFARDNWGTGRVLPLVVQHVPEEAIPLLARYERNSCTPKMVEEIMRSNLSIDIREVLSAISVPTMVAHTTGDPLVPIALGRYVAAHIPGARFVEIEGDFHGSWVHSAFPPEMIEFMAGEQRPQASDRVLATVLFTDIVSSTEHDVRLGDKGWRDLLDRHDEVARSEIKRFQGRLIKTTGDGVLATFDGPARAIACAQQMAAGTRPLGVNMRAGLHTGEIERRGEDIAGLGVVIARRVCDLAGTDEVLTSRTVKELVTGSGITFADRGAHTLKGVPDEWQLYAVKA